LALVLGAAIASACSLTYSAELDDAREGVAQTGPASDAAADSTAPTHVDGSPESGGPEGCASFKPPPKFCRDFDDDSALEADGFDVNVEPSTPNHVVALDSIHAYSGRRSLVTRIENEDAGCTYTQLTKRFPDIGGQRLEVRMKMRPSSPYTEHAPFVLYLDSGQAGYCAVLLYLESAAALINAQYGNPQKNDVRPINGFAHADEWTDFGITMTRAAVGVSARFAFVRGDGSVMEKTVSLEQCKLGGSAEIALGFHCDGGSAEVRYDDLRVDWE
jgi:hypothetical protein